MAGRARVKRPTGSRRAPRRRRGTTAAVAWASVAVLFLGLGSLPSPASDTHSAKSPAPVATRLSGRLLVAHGDNFAGHQMSMSAELRTTGGSVPLETRPSQHDALMRLAGRDVVVEGVSSGDSVSVQSVV